MHPKNRFTLKTDFSGTKTLWLEHFLGALFTKIKFTFLKSVEKRIFLPHSPFLKKKFSFLSILFENFMVKNARDH